MPAGTYDRCMACCEGGPSPPRAAVRREFPFTPTGWKTRKDGCMTKLADIIDSATGEAVSTPSLLRMLKVVASRLGTAPLEDWVDRELSGYGEKDDLPAYRGPFPATAMGIFVGPFQSRVTVAIPPGGLSGRHARRVRFHAGVPAAGK